ncbi:unnamed protein product [Closterium sp. NIES-53]
MHAFMCACFLVQVDAEAVVGPLRELLEQGGGGRGGDDKMGKAVEGEGMTGGGGDEGGVEGEEEEGAAGKDGDEEGEEEDDSTDYDDDDDDDDLLQWHCQVYFQAQPSAYPLLILLSLSSSFCLPGTAFYSLQSSINHSCCPNAHAFKRDEDMDGRAVLLASRDMKRGEQVFISYVEESLSIEERKEALADYGFVCRCDLCVAQGEQE